MSSRTGLSSMVVLLGLSGCAGAPSADPRPSQDVLHKGLQLAFQANVHGDIEPCG